MAIKLESYLPRWSGLSTDRKPFVGDFDGKTIGRDDLPVGATFLETDTGALLRWNGGAWVAPDQKNETSEFLQRILLELMEIKEAIVEGLA